MLLVSVAGSAENKRVRFAESSRNSNTFWFSSNRGNTQTDSTNVSRVSPEAESSSGGYNSNSDDDETSFRGDTLDDDSGFCASASDSDYARAEVSLSKFGMSGYKLNKLTTLLPGQMTRRAETTIKFDGSPTVGARNRIRVRTNRGPEAEHHIRGQNPFDEAAYYEFPLISKEKLRTIRQQSWQPQFAQSFEGNLSDFHCPYNVAWEIGKRGCVAFQRLSRSSLFFMLKRKYAVRFLTMDGTDAISFLTVYKVRLDKNGYPTKCAVFSAVDLLHAIWDPIEGSIKLEFFERKDRLRWRLRREVLKCIPWNFFEAMVVCLRELMVWWAVSQALAETKHEQAITQRVRMEEARTARGPAPTAPDYSDYARSPSRPSEEDPADVPVSLNPNANRNRSKAYAVPQVEPMMLRWRQAKFAATLQSGATASSRKASTSESAQNVGDFGTLRGGTGSNTLTGSNNLTDRRYVLI